MSPEFAERIFEPFERERSSTVSKIQGTGLGMAITKNIVDMMNGTIELNTEEGKGSEFIIRLLMRLQPNRNNTEKTEEPEVLNPLGLDDVPPATQNTESFKGKKLLLAEDNELNRVLDK